MTSPSAASRGGEFFLDTEQARAAVTELRKVYDGLADLRRQAQVLARQPATAHDLISEEAFDLLAIKAAGGPGSFDNAVAGAMDHVESLIGQMEADIVGHEENDARSARDVARS